MNALALWRKGLSGSSVMVALMLAACASPSPAPEASREVRSAPLEPADVERRARVRLELASAYFARGQTATALDEIKLALTARPDMPEALNLRGLILAAMGDKPGAESSFQRALQVKPGDTDTAHNYGWFLCQQARWTEADRMFALALAQPQNAEAFRTHLAQGACLARSGRLVEAERSLARYYELDPGNPAAAFNLSEVLYRRGELERARFYIRRVNSQPDLVNAQTLWLAARIERRMGNSGGVDDLSRQLRDRYPQAPETLLLDRGRWDD